MMPFSISSNPDFSIEWQIWSTTKLASFPALPQFYLPIAFTVHKGVEELQNIGKVWAHSLQIYTKLESELLTGQDE